MKNFIRTIKAIGTALVLTAMTSQVFVSCESYDDSALQEAIKDLQTRVLALEKQVAENVSALQSMVSLGSISGCDFNSETGKVSIKLLDGKTLSFDMNVTGKPLVTVVEKDGSYWWGICTNGGTTLLEINGKNVPVSVTPALKISADNEWMISADGGKTWVKTGIFQNTDSDDDGVSFFKNIAIDGDFLLITLADGKEIKVAIVGDAQFSASETSLWFTRAGEEKDVVLTMKNVKAYTITEKPEGWKAQINEEMLVITSPSDMAVAETSGTVKILSVFTNGAQPEILAINVQYDPELTMTADAYGTVKVNVSEHVGEGYAGYLIKAWKESDYTADAAAAWLNSEGYTATPSTQTAEFAVSALADNYQDGTAYVIFAAPYIPVRLITSGEASYEAEDLLTVTYTPSGTNVTVSDITYDSAHVSAELSDFGQYYGGICTTEDWNNFVRENFLELLSYGTMSPLTAASYEGTAAAFPDGVNEITMTPSTEYTLWLIPAVESGKYTENDFVTKTFTTTGISADATIAAPAYKVTEVTYGGFTAEVTPASGAYKTYAAILPAASLPATDEELVNMLIKAHNTSEGSAGITVSTNSYDSDTEVYILAVSMSRNGGYGTITKEKVALKKLEYSSAVGITECTATNGVGDVTLTLTFKGEPSTITYSVASYTYYTDEVLQEMMAMSQFGDVQDKAISTLTNGNQIYLSGLEIGTEYTFYAIVKDAEGKPSYLFTQKFTPAISVDYILSTDENYTYGMPEISGKWSGNTTYKLSINKPENCTKYWITVCDAEYLAGDVWIDTDKLISETLYGSEAHTDSISEQTYTYLNSASRVYMAWLDDKGNYHAIYEYNIQNDR